MDMNKGLIFIGFIAAGLIFLNSIRGQARVTEEGQAGLSDVRIV
jgi:hypothetical protein